MTEKKYLHESLAAERTPDLKIRIEGTRSSIPQLPAENPAPKFMFEVYGPKEITQERVDEVADYFRLTFNNEWEYVFCETCDLTLPEGKRRTAKDVYRSSDYVPLLTMDKFPIIPDCDVCEQPMRIFHEPGKTNQNMRARLLNSQDGYIVLMRGVETQKEDHTSERPEPQIKGSTYGYGADLEFAFYEFKNPHAYVEKSTAPERDFNEFLEFLNQTLPAVQFKPSTQVFVWNCVALNKEVRGRANFLALAREFFNTLPISKHDLYIVAETQYNSDAYYLFKTAGAIDVSRTFLTGEEVLIALKVSECVEKFNLPEAEFYALRDQIKSGLQR